MADPNSTSGHIPPAGHIVVVDQQASDQQRHMFPLRAAAILRLARAYGDSTALGNACELEQDPGFR